MSRTIQKPKTWPGERNGNRHPVSILMSYAASDKPITVEEGLRAGLWLVREALRQDETPSFSFSLQRRLRHAADCAKRWLALTSAWPTGDTMSGIEREEYTRAVETLARMECNASGGEEGEAGAW